MTDRGVNAGFAALTSPEAAVARGALVVVPVGAVEQHGPHLPLGTDIWIASRVAAEAVRRVEGSFLSEPLPVGCSGHHRSFPGSLSLRVETFQRMVTDVARCLAQDGFVPVFVNGHGGNRAPLSAALQGLLEGGVVAWAITYFETIADAVAERFPHDAVGHAGALETSLSLHLWPERMRSGMLPPPGGQDRYPDPALFSSDRVVRHRRFEEFGPDGIVGDPGFADSEAGEGLFKLAVERVADSLRRVAAESQQDQRRTNHEWNH